MLAALSLDFDDAISAAQVEAAVAGIERSDQDREFPEVTRIFVEAKSFEDHRRRVEGAAS